MSNSKAVERAREVALSAAQKCPECDGRVYVITFGKHSGGRHKCKNPQCTQGRVGVDFIQAALHDVAAEQVAAERVRRDAVLDQWLGTGMAKRLKDAINARGK